MGVLSSGRFAAEGGRTDHPHPSPRIGVRGRLSPTTGKGVKWESRIEWIRRSQLFGFGVVVLGMMERQQSGRYGANVGMTARAASYGRFVLAAIMAAAVFAFGLGGVANADVSGAVTVRSSSLTSEFPEGIRVRLTAS